MGRRAAINYLEKKPVPPVMFTGLMTATKENLDRLDLTTLRARQEWTADPLDRWVVGSGCVNH